MPPSASLVARRLSISRGAQPILVDVELTVGPESRLGVVGPNGVGKTTLLRALAGLATPDTGEVVRVPPSATVGYLSQEPDVVPNETLLAQLARRTGVAAAEAALETASASLAAGTPLAGSSPDPEEHAAQSPDPAMAYSDALDRYLALGAPDFEARAAATCADLGLSPELLGTGAGALSGGQLARASLAAILLARFDVFLLDEPTNDLDFAGLERLEDFLEGLAGGVVVVSHDRAFLERSVASVLELDPATHRASEYRGGWTAYLEDRATARRHATEAHGAYVAERDRLLARARAQRQWAASGAARARKRPTDHDKAQRDWRVNRTEKQAAKVRASEKALDRLASVDKPWEGWELHLDLATTQRSGDVVANLSGAVVERGGWRLGPLDLEIAWGERVALLGPNGSGKTTLLQVILGRLPLAAGRRFLGPGVVPGELDQRRARFLDAGGALLDAFVSETGQTLQEARSLLAKLGLGADHVGRTAATLSPGERTRACLALLTARGVNCLLLDEPTNHLDLPAIEQLEAALGAWQATLILVTHDRRLLAEVPLDRTVELPAPPAAATHPGVSPATRGDTIT